MARRTVWIVVALVFACLGNRALAQFQLTVSRAGNGSGTVTSTPAGINCGGTCIATYPTGTMVTLTASPDSASTFAGWSGACSGTGPCTVTMNSAQSVTATFTLNTYGLSVNRAGNGTGTVTSTPAGINCGSTCGATYNAGTMVSLTASPSSGSTFAGWSGACSGTGPCVVTMNTAQSVTATFTLNTYMLTVARAGTGTGTVTSTPAGINCGSTCSTTYNFGTMVTLTASPGSGSTFAGWSGACSGTGPCTVTMSSAQSVTATFTSSGFSLTVGLAGTGSGTVTSTPAGINCGSTCSATYNAATMVSLAAAPDSGSTFTGWSGACSGTGGCVVTMNSAQSVTATFTAFAYTLTVVNTGAGTGTVSSAPAGINCGATCVASFAPNTSVTLAAIPGATSNYAGFTGVDSSTGNVGTVLMNQNRLVSVAFTCAADFNRNGTLQVQDIFDFLAAWFSGCP